MRCFPQNPEALLSVRRPSSRRFNPKSLILLIALNLSLIIQKVRTVYFSDIGLSLRSHLRSHLAPPARLSLLSSLAPSLTPSSWSSLVKFILIYVLTFLPPLNLASNSAYANNLPIAVDGSTNTQIDTAANGVPIVNIAAPNSGGLSHNKFRDYNVNPSGLVINNATNNPNQVIQTNLAGLIVDNPNLANAASARVILNEVY